MISLFSSGAAPPSVHVPNLPATKSKLSSSAISSSCSPFSRRGSNFIFGGENSSSSYKNNNPSLRCPRNRRHGRSSWMVRASKTDYYATLNVERNATLDEIKSSYRKLARQYHPDMNKSPGSEDKFKDISAAYEVLSDNEKRSVYDRYGDTGLGEEYAGPSFGQQEVDPFQFFDSIFGESRGFFGGGQGGMNFNARSQRSSDLDIRYDLYLSLEEAVFGGERTIEFLSLDVCDECKGTGAKPGSSLKKCNDCRGRGAVRASQRTRFGVISQVSICPKCDGDGKMITHKCKRCHGKGTVKSKRSLRITIPPGVNDGSMWLRGEGHADQKRGLRGDLHVVVHIEEKHGIRREGGTLYSKVNIDYTEAILGTVLKVETVEGLKQIQIPAGTQPGDTVILPYMGVPDVNEQFKRGDHVFIVNVQIPKVFSKKERALVEELASLRNPLKDWRRERRKRQSQENKHAPGLWKSVRELLRGRSSGKGFASMSLVAAHGTTPPNVHISSRSEPLPLNAMLSHWYILFVVVTCIFVVLGRKIDYRTWAQRQPKEVKQIDQLMIQ